MILQDAQKKTCPASQASRPRIVNSATKARAAASSSAAGTAGAFPDWGEGRPAERRTAEDWVLLRRQDSNKTYVIAPEIVRLQDVLFKLRHLKGDEVRTPLIMHIMSGHEKKWPSWPIGCSQEESVWSLNVCLKTGYLRIHWLIIAFP